MVDSDAFAKVASLSLTPHPLDGHAKRNEPLKISISFPITLKKAFADAVLSLRSTFYEFSVMQMNSYAGTFRFFLSMPSGVGSG